MVKSFIMMVGEVDYNTLFISEYTNKDYNSRVFYSEISYIFYVVFILVMTVLVTNLLVSLNEFTDPTSPVRNDS